MVSGLILLFYFPRALKALQTTCLFHSFTQALFSVLKCFLTVTHIQKCNGCIPLRQITFWHYSITLSAVPNINHFNWVLLTVLRAKVRYQTYCRQKKMNPPDSFAQVCCQGWATISVKEGFFTTLATGDRQKVSPVHSQVVKISLLHGLEMGGSPPSGSGQAPRCSLVGPSLFNSLFGLVTTGHNTIKGYFLFLITTLQTVLITYAHSTSGTNFINILVNNI